MFNFSEFDGSLKAGSYSRASSAPIIIEGEENRTDADLEYGTAVAFNADGGVKKISAVTDVYAGIVVRDVYGDDKAPNNRIVNIAKICIGSEIRVLPVTGQTFTRGSKAYIQATGANAGKFTATASASTIDVGYIVKNVGTNGVIEITLNNSQVAGA